MKRVAAFLMAIAVFLSSCSANSTVSDTSATFYYLREEYLYGSDSSVIVPEAKATSGSRMSLSYLIALYAMGPTVEDHVMPYPADTKISCSELDNGDVVLSLSDSAFGLSDSEFTLASTCLALTCFDAIGCSRVTVKLGERSITTSRGSIVLKDNHTNYLTPEESQ